MIIELRRRHRRIVYSLGFLLPAAFVAGLAARHPVPVASALPAALAPESRRFDRVVWDRAGLWPQTAIRTLLLCNQSGGGGFAVELSAPAEIAGPDLLVYWVPGGTNSAPALPENAIFLGAFVQTKPAAIPLPGEAASNGALLLYSLADHEIVATSSLFSAR